VDRWARGSGFTLVEVMAAVTLLVVGVLAAASASAAITAMVGAGGADGKAAVFGRGILESLLPTACTAAAPGDTAVGALQANWSVARSPGVSRVVVVVTRAAAGGAGDTLTTARACPG